MIDFFGPGYAVAERMGLLSELESIHYRIERLVFSVICWAIRRQPN
jgi:hypothetical protein